jgi:hypothetical protein
MEMTGPLSKMLVTPASYNEIGWCLQAAPQGPHNPLGLLSECSPVDKGFFRHRSLQ